MRCLVTMFYKVEMLKTAAVGNWKRKLYVVAKKWQQLNERSNQISQVSPICILDIQIKVAKTNLPHEEISTLDNISKRLLHN